MELTFYQKQLLDPRWQKKRLEIFQRDKFCCLMCHSESDTLHVHHEKYCKNPWDAPNHDLKTLCFRCHKVTEICKKEEVRFTNVNRLSYPNEGFVYLLNSPMDDGRNSVVIIHNFSGEFEYNCGRFSKEFVEILLSTF